MIDKDNCSYCNSLQVKYPEAKLRACRHETKRLDLYTSLHQPKKKTSGARVFVHPRCLQGPASGAFTACLQEKGYNLDAISVGPADKKGHCELVRLRGTDPDGLLHLERMDGEQFEYRPIMSPTGGNIA